VSNGRYLYIFFQLNRGMAAAETVTIKKIYGELKDLKKEVGFIKKHMFDPDVVMTKDENRRFNQSMKELKTGKTTSLSALKKELGL